MASHLHHAHTVLPLKRDVCVLPILAKPDVTRLLAHRNLAEDAEAFHVYDGNVVVTDVDNPEMSFIISEGDRMASFPRIDRGDGLSRGCVDHRYQPGRQARGEEGFAVPGQRKVMGTRIAQVHCAQHLHRPCVDNGDGA